jgi:hypothetical protein
MSSSQTTPGLLGLDRSNTAFHPNTFLRPPSTNAPSTTSVSSSGKKKVHFDGESIAESSGTQPTSVGSTSGPESTTYQRNFGKSVETSSERRPPAQDGQFYDNFTGLGSHLPDIQDGGDFEADVGPDPPYSKSTPTNTTTIPNSTITRLTPSSDLNNLYHRRTRKAWVRAHGPNTKSKRKIEKPAVHNLLVKRKSSIAAIGVKLGSTSPGWFSYFCAITCC